MTRTRAAHRIALADQDREALERLAAVLRDLGHEVSGFALSVREAIDEIITRDPELAIVVLHDDVEHALALVDEMTASLDGPVMVFLDPPDAAFLASAADLGLNAFASSLDPEELQGAIEVAIRLHEQREALTTQVQMLSTALARRSVIERAKGVLMERDALTERQAFSRLQELAAQRGQRVADIAAELAG